MFKVKAAAAMYVPFFLFGVCIGLGEITVQNLNKKIQKHKDRKEITKIVNDVFGKIGGEEK